MFELLVIVAFVWLLIKAIGLAFKLTWGMAKIVASILMVLALPLLIVCLLFVGGAILIVPVAMIGMAAGIMKSCIAQWTLFRTGHRASECRSLQVTRHRRWSRAI